MSMDEDTELQDLLTQTLEANGCFAKIRAQLRASIYLALDEDETLQKKEPMLNRKLKASLATEEGRIMFCIVREFLEYFDLNFTLAVYEPESCLDSHYQYKDREQIIREFNMPSLMSDAPVLLQIIRYCRSSESKSRDFNANNPEKSIETESELDNKRDSSLKSESSSIQDNNNGNEINGNKTFNVNSPIFRKEDVSEATPTFSTEHSETDQLDKNMKIDAFNFASDMEKTSEQYAISDLEVSPPIVKDSKHSKLDSTKEKLKLPAQKIEKVKARNNLSSLSDLPPISVNKSRSNEMLLPPLYTKEFKEMNSQKEIEKMFDLEALDNYEEDFMSESEIDLVLNKADIQEGSKVNLVDERIKTSVNTERGIDVDVANVNTAQNNSISSVTSNDFEFNSNIDDILTSC